MNKTELIKKAAAKAQLSQTTMTTALAAVIETIGESLDKKESVLLRDFGTFFVRNRKTRKGFHPSTGKAIEIPAKEVVAFRASKKK